MVVGFSVLVVGEEIYFLKFFAVKRWGSTSPQVVSRG